MPSQTIISSRDKTNFLCDIAARGSICMLSNAHLLYTFTVFIRIITTVVYCVWLVTERALRSTANTHLANSIAFYGSGRYHLFRCNVTAT